MTAFWKIVIAVTIAAMSTALVTVLDVSWKAMKRWELATFDDRAQFFEAPGDSRIKLILLDQGSRDWADDIWEYGQTWPRELYVPILQFCRRAGVRVLAFDMQLSEHSTFGVPDDELFADAIREMPNFIGVALPSAKDSGGDIWTPEVPRSPFVVEVAPPGFKELVTRDTVRLPNPDLVGAMSVLGHVLGHQDADGVIRRVTPLVYVQGHWVPLLGFVAYAVGEGRPAERGGVSPWSLEVHGQDLLFEDIRVRLDEEARIPLRFRKDGDHGFEAFPAAAVIESELNLRDGKEPLIDPEKLRDCYVFFGASAAREDDCATPVKPVGPAVEVHATVLDNLLHSAAMQEAPPSLVFAFTLVMSLIGALWMIFARGAAAMWFGSGVLLVPPVFGYAAYPVGHIWPVVAPTGALLISLAAALIINYRTEGKQRRFIKDAFQHYLSPAVIEGLLNDPSKLELGGERRPLSIFFSDLQGFSSISEKLDPVDLTSLLNEYLTDMTNIVLEEGGTLDKYEGDAIIAFWNAPSDQPDHALRACRTALGCQRKLAEKRDEFTAKAGAPLRMRIGIHSGPVVVGNMGSKDRFDYTVLGDAANLAARLEGANKRFGTELMVSEATWSAARKADPRIVGRTIGRITVVGRKTPVKVLEPLGFAGEDFDEDSAAAFEHAWQLCEAGKWQEAAEAFRELPPDPLVETYLDRLRPVILGEEKWDGIWELTSKG